MPPSDGGSNERIVADGKIRSIRSSGELNFQLRMFSTNLPSPYYKIPHLISLLSAQYSECCLLP